MQSLTSRTNLCTPFHLGITLSSQLCLYLRHTHTHPCSSHRAITCSHNPTFQEPTVKSFPILKCPFFSPWPFSHGTELLCILWIQARRAGRASHPIRGSAAPFPPLTMRGLCSWHDITALSWNALPAASFVSRHFSPTLLQEMHPLEGV